MTTASTSHAERPLIVLMSGPPGAGKSTMAKALSERLLLPVIDKDLLRQGLRRTLDLPSYDGVPPGPPLFYGAVQAFLDLRISLIADMTLFRGPSEPDVRQLLAPRADLVCVHCFTHESVERFTTRSTARGLGQDTVDEILPLVVELQAELASPLELGCATIEIDTTDGIDRHIEVVAEFVETTRQRMVNQRRLVARASSE